MASAEERVTTTGGGRSDRMPKARDGRAGWRRGVKSAASVALGLALFALSLAILHRWAANVGLAELHRELAEFSLVRILLAILATALSFSALVGYEYYAVRYVGRKMATPVVALYSFITQSIAHAVGFAIFVGATIRYKLYAPAGFTILDIAKIQVFFTTTFGLGAMTLIGAVLVIEPGPLENALGLPHLLWRAVGVALLTAVLAFVTVGAHLRRPLNLFGHLIALPGPKVTVIQVLLGVADLLAVAAALYLLMPPEIPLDYLELLGVFVAAITVGLISHVPGSLGVFEGAVVLLVQPTLEQTAPLLGTLLIFRAIYYILPLALGALCFGAVQARRWLRAGRRHAGRREGA